MDRYRSLLAPLRRLQLAVGAADESRTALEAVAPLTSSVTGPGASGRAVACARRVAAALIVCLTVAAADTSLAQPLILSHSASQTITPGNSVTCLDNSSPVTAHTATSFWRVYDLVAQGITGDICIEGVEIGVETATACRKLPIWVRLYVDDDPNLAPTNDLTLVAQKRLWLDETIGSMIVADISASIPAGSFVAVEVHSPLGQPNLGYFLPGSNSLGQSAPSYLSATTCGYSQPVSIATLGPGAAGMHLVLNLRYTDVACVCPGPTDLTASQIGTSQDLQLNWTNRPPTGSNYDWIEVIVDGVVVVTVPGTTQDVVLVQPGPYSQVLEVSVRASLFGNSCLGLATAEVVMVQPYTPIVSTVTLTSSPGVSLAAHGGTYTDSLVVSAAFPVDQIQVSVHVSHPQMSDLVVTLTAPNGQSTTLHSNSFFRGGFLQPDLDVTYTDEGTSSCNVPSDCGCFVLPSGPGTLNDLRCGISAGAWQLTVTDLLGQASGTLNSWTLELNDRVCCRAPSDLTAAQDCNGTQIELNWTNNDTYDFLHIVAEYNGTVVDYQFSGTDTSYLFPNPGPGLHTFTLLGQCAGGLVVSAPVETEVYSTDGTETDIVLALEGLQTGSGLGTIDSGAAIEAALLANGRNPMIVRATPSDFPCFDHVDVVWVVTGTFPNDYRLSQSEGDFLASLNSAGIGLYFESADHWGFQHLPSLLDDRDGISGASNGDDSLTQMDGFDTTNGIDLSLLLGVSYTQDYHLSDDNDQLAVSDPSVDGTSHVLWRNHPDTATETDYVTGVFRDNIHGGNMISTSWEFGGYGADASTLVGHYLGVLIGESQFVRADCNNDGFTDIGDVVYLLNYLFPNGAPPAIECSDACDANDTGNLNIADAVHILWALLVPQSGVTIPPPNLCGPDSTPSALSCIQSAGCP